AFIVPYVFAFNPSLLFEGVDSVLEIGIICVTSIAGIFGVAAALNGFLFRPINPLYRLVLAAGGLSMLMPGLISDAAGLGAITLVCVLQHPGRSNLPQREAMPRPMPEELRPTPRRTGHHNPVRAPLSARISGPGDGGFPLTDVHPIRRLWPPGRHREERGPGCMRPYFRYGLESDGHDEGTLPPARKTCMRHSQVTPTTVPRFRQTGYGKGPDMVRAFRIDHSVRSGRSCRRRTIL
ncbi:MAG: hypothetical protein MJ061_02780, partial [Mailhella sp.]|nr:hypothetical protein [Mailhella sp.]